jgi:glycosyltransferase involved in cell wall biosynthesis
VRVLHVITRLILGGAQENTLFNCEDLVRLHGDEVTLATGPAEGPEGDLFDRARKTMAVRLVPELRRAVAPRDDWRAYRVLLRLIAELRPDVVHTHSSKAGILGRAAAWKAGVPAILHTIHGLPFHPQESRWRNALYIRSERWAARRCHRLIGVAQAMVDQALAAGIGTRGQYVVIPSGMEVEPFLNPPRSRAEVRAELGIPADAVVAAKVARLFEHKGHDDLLDIAPQLLGPRPAARLLFIGGGIERERLERRVAELGLTGKVVFAGLVPTHRVPELLGAADVVVHASYREVLARALPQGLIAGKPVVSYDVDGAREVALPGRTGWLTPLADRPALLAALAEAFDRPDLRAKYGAAGRELCAERFRHDAMTAAIRAEYLAVLGPPRAS